MKSFLNGKFGPTRTADLDSNPRLRRSGLGPVSVIDPSLFTVPYDAALVARAAARRRSTPSSSAGRCAPARPTPGVPFRPLFYRRFDAGARAGSGRSAPR